MPGGPVYERSEDGMTAQLLHVIILLRTSLVKKRDCFLSQAVPATSISPGRLRIMKEPSQLKSEQFSQRVCTQSAAACPCI